MRDYCSNRVGLITSLIAYVLAYSYGLSFVFDLALPVSGKSLAVFTGLFGIASVALYIIPILRGERVPKSYYSILFISGVLSLSVLFSAAVYGQIASRFSGVIASFFVRAIPSLMVGAYVAYRGSFLHSDCWIVPLFAVASLVLFSVAITNQSGSMVTYAGQGIDRQTMSYAASFLLCLGFYYFAHSQQLDIPLWQGGKLAYLVVLVCAACDVSTVLAGGGRGAVVVCVVFLAYYLIKAKVLLSPKNYLVIFALFSAAGLMLSSIPSLAASVGVDRIVSFFSGSMDQSAAERLQLYRESLNLFFANPLIGYGAGGALYEIGIWPHNIFLNVLVDFGLVGIVVLLVALFFCAMRIRNCLVQDFRFELVLITGLSCFIELLFSGCYLSDGGIWLMLGYCLVGSSKPSVESLDKCSNKH